MSASSNWRPLPLEPPSLVPTLLSSIETGPSNYTVRLTDTANLWVESLDYKAIRGRGLVESTSIDPSDSPENMTKLLSCLQEALEPSHKDHSQTTLSLSQASPSDAGEGGLTLVITCSLPGLEPLVWPIHLRKAAASVISAALVLPLVQDQHAKAREVESLAAMLSQKDMVISKLLDKLEANGTALEHIFNQLSGKKKVSRSAAGSKVRGLAPFDRRQWQDDLDQQGSPYSAQRLIREVFKGDNVQRHSSLDTEDSPKLDRWWLDLKGTLQVPQRVRATYDPQPASSHSSMNRGTPPRNDDDEDDDFQIQETPPHLVTRSKGQPVSDTVVADDASTESDDDELVSSQPVSRGVASVKTGETAPPKPAMSRMGAIGGKKTSPPKRSASPAAAKDAEDDDDGSETASDPDLNDNEDNATASTAEPSPSPSPPRKSAPAKGRMGQIGGQATKSKASTEGQSRGEVASSSHGPKLGMVGMAQVSMSSDQSEHATTEARGRQHIREASKEAEQPRETSTERADRRRAELKQELERKAAAGPAKKKRKF